MRYDLKYEHEVDATDCALEFGQRSDGIDQEALWYEEDQSAAIRPELRAAWSKLRTALGEFAYDLAAALYRASVQGRRSIVARKLWVRAGIFFDHLSMRIA